MNDNTGQQQSSLLDTVKLLGSVLILLAGIVSYYYLIQISILFRVLIILASVVISLVIFFQTLRGKTLWEFFQGSRVEIKKVIWPTRQETLQTTLTVFVFVLIMGIFFWLLDFLLLFFYKRNYFLEVRRKYLWNISGTFCRSIQIMKKKF